MPLLDMSTNVQESEAASRKRSHDQFAEAPAEVQSVLTENTLHIKAEDASAINGSLQDVPSVSITEHGIKRERSGSPAFSSDSELSSIRSSPPPLDSDPTPSTSPMAPGHTDSPSKAPSVGTQASTPSSSLQPTAMGQPQSSSVPSSALTAGAAPPKKKRKTPAEKEAEERERALKKAKKDEELAAKAKEKEEREAAKLAKAAEKAKAAAEKDEKERKKKEEEEKKKRAQPSIFGFLKTKPAVLGDVSPNKQPTTKAVDSSPIRPKAPLVAPVAAAVSPAKDSKPVQSAYAKLFKDFFVKSDVKMAPTPFQMDEDALVAKSKILDEFIGGGRGPVEVKPFDPVAVFHFNGIPTPRGKQHLAVKKVMAEIFGDPLDGTADSRTESQQVRLTSVQEQLNSIPVKVLSFWEDVRPAYVGTVTSAPEVQLRKLARRPKARIMKLNYDYDSEAEWEEEEGEDLDDEELEDEDNDADEEMGDFLDDAEDTAAARPAFLGDTEPVSTGVCFEDRKRLAHNADGEECATVYKYRMEFLLESLEHHHSIDPFSTEYWEPKVAPNKGAKATSCGQSKITSAIKSTAAGMAPPPAPTGSSSSSAATPTQPDWSTLVPKGLLSDFKRTVVGTDINFLTKVGIVDMLSKKFPSATKNQVRATLDFVAERSSLPGAKKSAKVWVLRPEHALDKN